jgi:hypothetical protein
MPCLVAFASGALVTGALCAGEKREKQSIPYGDMQLQLPQELMHRFVHCSSNMYDTPIKFSVIQKKAAAQTFSERLAVFHGIPVSPLWTVPQTEALLTPEFLAQQQQYFSIPQYAATVGSILIPLFMDAAELSLTRYCVLTTDSVHFTFYCPDTADAQEEQQLLNEISSAIELTLTLVRLCNKLHSRLSVHVFMNALPKVFDSVLNAPVGSARFINSGVTTSSHSVLVFRREEMVKVLCHEVIHALHADCYGHSAAMALAISTGTSLSVTGQFNPAEAVTETIARVLYSMHVSRRSEARSEASSDDDALDLDVLLQRQLHFAVRQAATILYMNGISKCSDLETLSIHQDTYAIEYYVFTAALLYGMAQHTGGENAIFAKLCGHSDIVAGHDMAKAAVHMIKLALHPGSSFRNAMDVLLGQALFYKTLRMSVV